jgi:cytochrome c oxidase subunit 2
VPVRLFPWLPPEASTLAWRYDLLFFAVTAITGIVVLAVVIVALVFAIRYRRGSPASRARGPADRLRKTRRRLEYAWIGVPLVVFLCIGAGGAWLYMIHYAAPPDAMPIYVVGRQWMWKLEHANGKREIDELHVPRGRPVRLVMTSQDVIHSFFVPAFRIKQDVLPGRYTELWFEATETGDFHLFCAEYCGTDHSGMIGRVVVMEPARFAQWLETGAPAESMAQRGEQLFRSLGCSGCHGERSTVHAPKLEGVFGRPVPLEGGGTAIADERYVRDSILLPKREVAAGYAPIMPSFAGRISEEEVLDLVAYIRSIGPGTPASR